MSLHYLHYFVKLEMSIVHVLPLSCHRRTPEFIPRELYPQTSPDLIQFDNKMWEILQDKVYNTRITDLKLSRH